MEEGCIIIGNDKGGGIENREVEEAGAGKDASIERKENGHDTREELSGREDDPGGVRMEEKWRKKRMSPLIFYPGAGTQRNK